MNQGEEHILVTLGGECFRSKLKRQYAPTNRDAILHFFSTEDLVADRGARLVSVAISETARTMIANFESRQATICLNGIRKAFDRGLINFDHKPEDPSRYTEIPLYSNDFASPSRPALDTGIRSLITHTAYWCGYKTSSDPGRIWVEFASETDLDYLSVDATAIKRVLWLLSEQGLIELKRPFPTVGKPTAKLVEMYESQSPSDLPGAKVFPHGTQYDSYKAISGILKSARKEIFIIDNYIDDSVLDMITSTDPRAQVKMLTYKPKADFGVALNKFKSQYQRTIEVRKHSREVHDRVIIIDQRDFYSLGASIKDAGNQFWILHKIDDPEAMSNTQAAIAAVWQTATAV